MNIAIIGRTEILYKCIELFEKTEHKILLIVTSKEAPEYTVGSDEFKAKAIDLGAEFIHTANILTAIPTIESLPQLDLGISLNYSGIIPEQVISKFRIGILNAHGGDLPKYKGNACQAWAIINGEDKIGLCIHKMIGGELDNGNIILKEYLPIDLNTTITEVYKWFEQIIPKLFFISAELLNKDPNYCMEVQSQYAKDSLRCYPRRPEDSMINWKNDAVHILRLINASTFPYSGAISLFENEIVNIMSAELYFDDEVYCSIPGQVALVIPDVGVVVITGGGKILVKDVIINEKLTKADKLVKSSRNRFKNA
jgi:methionyl-tRNA formyltransferase